MEAADISLMRRQAQKHKELGPSQSRVDQELEGFLNAWVGQEVVSFRSKDIELASPAHRDEQFWRGQSSSDSFQAFDPQDLMVFSPGQLTPECKANKEMEKQIASSALPRYCCFGASFPCRS